MRTAGANPRAEAFAIEAGGEREERDAAAIADAYAYCGKLARTHYENFTIASWLMPLLSGSRWPVPT